MTARNNKKNASKTLAAEGAAPAGGATPTPDPATDLLRRASLGWNKN